MCKAQSPPIKRLLRWQINTNYEAETSYTNYMLQKPNLVTSVYILLSTPRAYKQTHPQTVCVGQKRWIK